YKCYDAFDKKNPLADRVLLSAAKQAKSEADRKQQECDQISKRIDTGACLRIQILRARDFAVATIENTVDVKKRCAGNEPEVIAAHEEKKTNHGQNCDQ